MENKPKSTPGPWRSHGELINSDAGEIAALPFNERLKHPFNRANAALIASAPEMLEALERAKIQLMVAVNPTTELTISLDMILKAINKAKGGE